MVSIADISFPQTSLSQKTNIDITAYQADLAHYIRKRPTRRMRVIKNFLEDNLRDPNQHIEGIDRELSYLYSKFCEEQNAMRKLNRMNTLKIKPKSINKKKKTSTEVSGFKEYSDYLEQFADKDCNLLQEIQPKPGANAEIFKRVFLKHKNTTFSQREPKKEEIPDLLSPQKIPSIENDFSYKSFDKKPIQSERKPPLKPNRSLTVTLTGRKPESQRVDSSNYVSPLLKRPQSVGVNSRRMNSLPVPAKSSTKEDNKSSEKISTTNVSNVALVKIQKIKKPIVDISLEEKTIEELKVKINKHLISQRSCKKDIPFQFDKNFLASRRIQKKQQAFAVRTGLIQAKVNMSFGI